jgi:HSP20 family protein
VANLKRIYLEELARIQEQINRLFEQRLLSSSLDSESGQPPGMWAPAVDVLETDGAYLLHAELPGLRREDIELAVSGSRVELSGHREPLGEGQAFLRMERSYGAFRRIIELAGEVNPEPVQISFRRGVLQVTLSKRSSSASHSVRGQEA